MISTQSLDLFETNPTERKALKDNGTAQTKQLDVVKEDDTPNSNVTNVKRGKTRQDQKVPHQSKVMSVTTEKKFHCTYCTYKSSYSSNLTKHNQCCKERQKAYKKDLEERVEEQQKRIELLQAENIILMKEIREMGKKLASLL